MRPGSTRTAAAQRKLSSRGFLLLVVWLVASCGWSEPLTWLGPPLEPVLEQAKAEGRPVLIRFMDGRRTTSHDLESEFQDPNVTRQASQFLRVHVDARDPESWPLRERFQVTMAPTMVILDSEGRVLDWREGYVNYMSLTMLLADAAEGRDRLSQALADVEENPDDPEALEAAVAAASVRGRKELAARLIWRIGETDPRNERGLLERAYRSLARAFLGARQPEPGLELLARFRALGVKLQDPDRHSWLVARLQVMAEDPRVAATFTEYLERNSEPSDYAEVASFLAEAGVALERAEHFALRAIELSEGKAHHLSLAEVYTAQGRYDEALSLLPEATCCVADWRVDLARRRIERARELTQSR